MEKPSERITTYLPDNSLRQGYRSLLRDIVVELVSSRWLIYQLFKRDIASFYKQSVLGVFWIFVVPLVTVGTFALLRGSGVVTAGQVSTPYPIFAVLGIAVWQLFAQGIVAGANALVGGGEMISRINFSKKSLVIAAMGRTLVSFAVLAGLLVVLFAVYSARGFHVGFHAGLFLAPLALVPLMLLTLGASFYLALLNGVIRDVGTMLSMLVTFLMLLTPVLYERPKLGPNAPEMAVLLDRITAYNPLYYLVEAPRDLVLTGRIADPRGFFIASAASVLLFFFALVGFHVAETRIAERI
ncbi:MAG: ABC transporter permease [Polyangiaceae bacterium]|nr:ABC transporter permease [Polyangiaceae bacterium]NUQ75943.1 ABC transporter permease [Polyangiaceae bacterium]